MTPEAAGFGAYARGEVHDGRIGATGWLRRAGKVLREYASTLRVKEFRKHLSIYLLVQVSMDVFGQTFVFFVIYNWNHTAAFASLLLGCAAISLPLMPVFGWAMTKIGPKRLYAINFAGCRRGMAVRRMATGRRAAGRVVDGVRSGRRIMVLRVQVIVRLPAMGRVPVHCGH